MSNQSQERQSDLYRGLLFLRQVKWGKNMVRVGSSAQTSEFQAWESLRKGGKEPHEDYRGKQLKVSAGKRELVFGARKILFFAEPV
jgi:hypothetical protein